MQPRFFATPLEFRSFLQKNHATLEELWVGLYKRNSGRPSITWPESVDVALCFGWIDGVRKSLDQNSYVIRFTPRRPRSRWSKVNADRARQLIALGLMQPPGLRAFEGGTHSAYSYEQREAARFDGEYEKLFRAERQAWDFFQAQPAWYRRTATWWVVSAKKEETRRKRLQTLIEDSTHGRTIRPLARPRARINPSP